MHGIRESEDLVTNPSERAQQLVEALQELVYHETETSAGGVQRCNFYLESELAIALLDRFAAQAIEQRDREFHEMLSTVGGAHSSHYEGKQCVICEAITQIRTLLYKKADLEAATR